MLAAARAAALGSLLVVLTASGCAAEAEAEPPPATEGAQTEGAPAPSGSEIDEDHAVHIKVDGKKALYNAGAFRMGLCTDAFPKATLSRIENSPNQGEPGSVHLVIEKGDGKWDSRVVNPWPNPPTRQPNDDCAGGEILYVSLANTPDAGHLKHVNLAGFFATSLGGDRFSCGGGFSLAKDVAIDVKSFSFDDGELSAPELSITVDGDITPGASAGCTASWSKSGVFFAGLIPVVYEVELGIGLALSATKATHITTTFGTDGGSLKASTASFAATPSVALGVTFYGLVGGYVGADFPMTVTPKPGKSCSPHVSMDVWLKAGVQAGLLGIGDLPISKSVGLEASKALGPFVIRSCK